MELILYLLAKSVQIFLDIMSFAMMIRVLLPIVADVENNPIFIFTVAITEPIIAPVRILMDKMGIGNNTPFDMGFMATYLIIFIIGLFLPAI